MPKTPRITAAELVKALQKLGFQIARIKGSHHVLKHVDGRRTVVPVHRGEVIGVGLMSKILVEAEITIDELIELL